MFEYTKATLKQALQDFNEDDSPEYVDVLDDLVRLGEARLAKRLDLDSLDSISTALTVADSSEVTKPDNLIVARLIVVDLGDSNRAVHHRSRAWIESFNVDDETGEPKYYCELDSERWSIAPIAAQEWTLRVHGLYRPTSIVDGDDDATTWFSTRIPELLLLSCSIEALEFLKFWSKKASQESTFESQAAAWLKTAGSLQRSDAEDIVGQRQNKNKPDTQAE